MINTLLMIDIVEIFQNYGVIFTLFAVFLLIAYMIINNSFKRMREQDQQIDSLYNRLDKIINKASSDDNNELTGRFMNFAENANKIQIQMYHLLQNFGAERVSIYEYHNGGKNLAGVEFKKCSNTYEAVSLETKPVIKEMQNLPLSINPLWSKILSTRDDIIIPSVEKIEDAFLKSYLTSQNIKTYYGTMLQDYDNTPIGFITLECYTHFTELNEEQLEEFNEIAIKISVLINIK